MKEVIEYQRQRIEALEKTIKIQEELISQKDLAIDEITFKYADSKARYNMLIRNIEVIDTITVNN